MRAQNSSNELRKTQTRSARSAICQLTTPQPTDRQQDMGTEQEPRTSEELPTNSSGCRPRRSLRSRRDKEYLVEARYLRMNPTLWSLFSLTVALLLVGSSSCSMARGKSGKSKPKIASTTRKTVLSFPVVAVHPPTDHPCHPRHRICLRVLQAKATSTKGYVFRICWPRC